MTPIVYSNIDEAWLCMMNQLLEQAEDQPAQASRDGDVVAELIGWQFALDASKGQTFLRNAVRDMDPAYCAAEILWCFSGSDRTEPLLPYAPSYQEKYGELTGIAYGAYGARLINQWSNLIDTLQAHPEGRQAVLQIWRSSDLYEASFVPPGKRDIPCLTEFMFLRRSGKLHMSAVMRSQDAWLGLPCDVTAFTAIQRIIAAEVDCEVGQYTHCIPGSTHLYKRYLERAKKAISEPRRKFEPHGWKLDDTFSSMRVAIELEQQLATGKIFQADRLAVLGDMATDLLRACAQKIKPGMLLAPAWSSLHKEYQR